MTSSTRPVPTCKKCGEQHWNVVRCDTSNVKQQEIDPTEKQPPVQWSKDGMDGFRPFGNVASEGLEFLGNSANSIRRR